jgi:hypothetical protein
MPVTTSDLARMAGNIASGFTHTIPRDNRERMDYIDMVSEFSVDLAVSIAVKIEAVEGDDDQVKEASAAVGEALNGDEANDE